jgi:nucleoside-diphosphate-sugar epimerase
MVVLITGIEGFLGRHLANKLHAADREVIGLDVAATDSRPWPVYAGDVADLKLLDQLFAEHNVADIVHCGGISGPHVCNSDPARVFQVNVIGTLNLFETARQRDLGGRIVFASSSSVYGEAAEKASSKTPVTEDLPLLASEPYGCSKVACEGLLRAYVRQFDVDAVALRIAIVYGPGRTTYCGISQIIMAALAGEPILLDGSDTALPLVHVDDVCAAIIASLDAPKENIQRTHSLAYNVTGPGHPTFAQIAGVVQSLTPAARVKYTGEPDKYAMNARKMSLSAIKRDLGWEPRVTIEEGVRSLAQAIAR